MVVLGAGAEMGPYRALMRWGASCVALDLPRTDVQDRIREHAVESAGRVHVPARIVTNGAADVGADLVTELPAVAEWLDHIDGRLVLGNYCYADGATHVRVSMAADALAKHLVQQRPDTALAFLATPTDTFAVPAEEVAKANAAYASRVSAAAHAAARRQRRAPPAAQLPAGRRPRHQRCAGSAAGPQLRARQAAAALARHDGPQRGHDGVAQRRSRHAYAIGRQEQGAGCRVRRSSPVRRRGLRPGDEQHADGGTAGARPARRRRAAGRAVAGRGGQRRARRAVDHGLPPAQRPRASPPSSASAPSGLQVPASVDEASQFDAFGVDAHAPLARRRSAAGGLSRRTSRLRGLLLDGT